MTLIPSIAGAEGWVDVPCTINNKPIVLKYDSGAQLSAIGINVAKTLGIARTDVVGRIPAMGAGGLVTNTPLAEVAISIAGGQAFRTRVLLDSEGWFNGILGRNDLNTTHSICFGSNNLVQLYPFAVTRRIASASPPAYISGTVNGSPVNFLFDTGAVGAQASSSISAQVAQAAGITRSNYVATTVEQTFQGTMGGQGGIAVAMLTLNGSQPFTTYVNIDPAQTDPGLISRQDVTRVFRACMTPRGLTLSSLSQPQIRQKRVPVTPPVSHPQPVETSPQPSRIRPVSEAGGGGDNTLILAGLGLVGVVVLVMVFQK